mgnify:CR=1 FL=1
MPSPGPKPLTPHKIERSPGQSSALATIDEQTWAMFIHLSTFLGWLVPVLGFVVPLGLWLFKSKESTFVDHHGKEAINFQLTMLILSIPAIIMVFFLIGIPLLLALAAFSTVVTIIATVAAHQGKHYHYPINIRFIR